MALTTLPTAAFASGSVGTTQLADGAVTTEKLVADVNFRNLIINGDMSIAQRGAGPSGSFGGSGYNAGPDRWRATLNSLGQWTTAQSTDVPTGEGFSSSLKLDCTSAAASPAATAAFAMVQRIEGQMLQSLRKGTSSAKSTRLSFWVKSNKTGTYIVRLLDLDNSRHISQAYTINSANTWEKKTLSYEGDTTGTLDNDNARSLDVLFYLGVGSNFTGGTLATSWETSSGTNANACVGQINLADSTSNEWYLTGVQWEVGTSASDFEFLPYDVNLQRCQRYYHFDDGQYGNGGKSFATTDLDFPITQTVKFPTTMRATPTVTISGTNLIRDDLNNTISANVNTATKDSWIYGVIKTGSGSEDYGVKFSDIKFDAEL